MKQAERIIEWIKNNHRFDHFEMKCHEQSIQFQNDRFIVKIEVYEILVMEESIYDRYSDTVIFYLHHECQHYENTISMISEFMRIANEFDKERKQSHIRQLCDFQNAIL